MRDKLITYVDYLFAGAPETQENRDLKNEVLQNTLERYDDLIASGKAPGAAITLQFPESETFRKCWTKENSLRKIPPL